MTVQHSPRHRAAGPAGFGRSPWPSQPIAVIPSPRPPSERPGRRRTGATTGETPTSDAVSREAVIPGVESGRIPVPRHAAPEGLAEVADLETVMSAPAPLARPEAPTGRRRTGGAIVRLTARPGAAPAPSVTTPPAPSSPWSRGRSLVIGALAVVVVLTGAAATTLLVTGALSSHATPPVSPWAQAASRVAGAEPTAGPAAAAVVPPAPTVASPIATLSGDGRLTVGVDIAPGTYRTAGPASPTHDCSWSRRGQGAEGETVLASGVPTAPATVTLRPGDAVFVTRGCAPWTRGSS